MAYSADENAKSQESKQTEIAVGILNRKGSLAFVAFSKGLIAVIATDSKKLLDLVKVEILWAV